MLQLPNNCRSSAITVIPSNWKTVKSIAQPWRIYYRFYDPSQPLPKMVNIKAMNRFEDVGQRKEVTRLLIKQTLDALERGYNPFLKRAVTQTPTISGYTPLSSAIDQAFERLTMEPTTKKDIRNVLNNIIGAARSLFFDAIPVQDVKKSHIKLILEECEKRQKNFSDKTFNTYRKYLSIIFNELSDLDAVEINVVREIKKRNVVSEQRKTLTQEQRIYINNLLESKYPAFHRFVHIFFHSGARITELLRLKVKDVDLVHQRYTTLVIKGKSRRSVQRTIKNIALPYWTELVKGAGEEDYLFSRGLKPGAESIQPYQITKRWYRLIKNNEKVREKFGNIGDLYSLKHTNTSGIVDQLGDEAAANQMGHTTTKMTAKVYDIRRGDRLHEQLKKATNSFV